MKFEQCLWTAITGWQSTIEEDLSDSAQLVLAFGARQVLEDSAHFEVLRNKYPNADILMASTAGEILDTKVYDNAISVTAICFEKTELQIAHTNIRERGDSQKAGQFITKQLLRDDLAHILVISDGQEVNGSKLVTGLNEGLPKHVSLTGGLAGDGPHFKKTLVGLNEPPKEGNIVAIGFYGNAIQVSHGSMGGWDSFGPERTVTRAQGNKLFELDGKNALELYKTYLGSLANELPGSALLFPLSINIENSREVLVRTILSVSEEEQSMTFAGDIPLGSKTRLMKANFDRLIDGAIAAAENSLIPLKNHTPTLALLISCVGRKLVLNQRVEEEVEEARLVLGDKTGITGFYSYGEISPLKDSTSCELHNQTMTITTFSER